MPRKPRRAMAPRPAAITRRRALVFNTRKPDALSPTGLPLEGGLRRAFDLATTMLAIYYTRHALSRKRRRDDVAESILKPASTRFADIMPAR